MSLAGKASAAFGILVLGAIAAGAAYAQQQDDTWNKIDLKPLVPQFVPILPPLPPNSQLNPGSVGGAPSSYSAPALQDSFRPPETGPGLRLTVPSR